MTIDMFSSGASDLKPFLDRKVKAKEVFTIKEVPKVVAYEFVKMYHYLESAKFFSKYSYGLYNGCDLVGVSTFSNPQGISTLKGWFGVSNDNQDYLELSRLCMLPELNGSNATSYLLGGSMRKLKGKGVKGVITLADDSRHNGAIYQVCNFKYYGLTDKKTDFYSSDKGLNPRGSTRDLQGVWMPRARKHRYCYILDKKSKPLYTEKVRPTKEQKESKCTCKDGLVFDNRFKKTYACPRCNDFKKLGLLDINDLPSWV